MIKHKPLIMLIKQEKETKQKKKTKIIKKINQIKETKIKEMIKMQDQ